MAGALIWPLLLSTARVVVQSIGYTPQEPAGAKGENKDMYKRDGPAKLFYKKMCDFYIYTYIFFLIYISQSDDDQSKDSRRINIYE